MKNNDNHINKSELIEKFLAGGLNDREKKLFEELRAKDPFFREALEGLGSMDTDTVLRDLYALNKNRSVFQSPVFRVAAGIVVLLIAGYLVITYVPFNPSDETVAQKTLQTEEPAGDPEISREAAQPEPEEEKEGAIPDESLNISEPVADNTPPSVEQPAPTRAREASAPVQEDEPGEVQPVTIEPTEQPVEEEVTIKPSIAANEEEAPDELLKKESGATDVPAQALSLAADDLDEPTQSARVAEQEAPDLPVTAPAPSDGWLAYNRYLSQNMVYPAEADSNNVAGTVIVSALISADGTSGNYTIKKGLGYGCDEEALRLVREGPAWTPARAGQEPVEQEVDIEITFPAATGQ